MKPKTFKKGQSTLEYAIIVVVVVGALLAMQWYIKGGYQGRLRRASDDIGEQYSPTRISTNYTTNINSTTNEQITGGSLSGGTMPTSTSNFTRNETRVGSEALEGLTATNYQR